jgi:Ca2+-binding EF-hand superfamily protein
MNPLQSPAARLMEVVQAPPTPAAAAFEGFTLEELEAIKTTFFPGKEVEEGGEGGAGGEGESASGISEGRFVLEMRSLGFGHLPLPHMHHLLDTDGNGLVEQQELLSGLSALRSHGVDTLRFCFDIYDADGSGEISFGELAHVLEALLPAAAGGHDSGDGHDAVLSQLTPRTAHATTAGVGHDMHFDTPFAPQLYALFERLDTNHDGKISWEEFRAGVMAEPLLATAFHAHNPTPTHETTGEVSNKRQRTN